MKATTKMARKTFNMWNQQEDDTKNSKNAKNDLFPS